MNFITILSITILNILGSFGYCPEYIPTNITHHYFNIKPINNINLRIDLTPELNQIYIKDKDFTVVFSASFTDEKEQDIINLVGSFINFHLYNISQYCNYVPDSLYDDFCNYTTNPDLYPITKKNPYCYFKIYSRFYDRDINTKATVITVRLDKEYSFKENGNIRFDFDKDRFRSEIKADPTEKEFGILDKIKELIKEIFQDNNNIFIFLVVLIIILFILSLTIISVYIKKKCAYINQTVY